MNKDIRFQFETSALEVYKDATGRPHVRAVASDTLEDRQGDVITETCINQMAKQVTRGIPLLPDHRASFEIGMSMLGDTRRNPASHGLELVCDFQLDDRYTEATVLYGEVESGHCKRQLSIGGYLNKTNPRAAYLEERNGKVVTVLDDIVLDHIAVTREGKAANPRTNFVDAVFKAIDEAGIEITKDGLIDKPEPVAKDSTATVPAAVAKLDAKSIDMWKSVWKDTLIRQMHIEDQTVEQAEASAIGVASAILSKQLGEQIDVKPDEYGTQRTKKETYVIGTTSKTKDGHTHLWIAREVGEKILDGLMLTVKGHDHKILETGTCDSDSDHEHTLVSKTKKVAEPSTELSAPVGLLYFGKGYDSEDDVRTWLDSKGIEPLSISRVADSTFVVEFSLPSTRVSENDGATKEEAEMPKKSQTEPQAEIEKATVVYKAWPMSQERRWSWVSTDGDAVLGPNKDNWSLYKAAHTYFDDSRGATPEIKGAYSFPHHKVADDGLSTYIGGVIAATAILNGARGGFRRDTSEAGRRALHAHLAKHYGQAGRTAPPLKSNWLGRLKEDFTHPNPQTLAERDFEDFLFSLEENGFKDEMPDFLTKEWWLQWDENSTGLSDIPETEKGIWTEIEKATVEDAETSEKSVEEKQEASVDETKSDDGGKNDDKSPVETSEEVAKSGDDTSESEVTPVDDAIKALTAATTKALADIAAAVSNIGKRVDALESSTETATEEKAEETPAVAADEKMDDVAVEEKTIETAPDETKETGEPTPETPVEETSSKDTNDAQAKEFFESFHALLAGMGMTAKDFFSSMVQKNLDGVSAPLTETVQKAVESSFSSLQKGVMEKVEKSVDAKMAANVAAATKTLDAKLSEVTKDFAGTVEKLNGRLEKVERVGGVPQGAHGQESSDDTDNQNRGTFAGVFSSALRSR